MTKMFPQDWFWLNKKRRNAYLEPWIRRARSLVILPDSTVPTHAASSFWVKSRSLALSSSLALFVTYKFNFHINNLYYCRITICKSHILKDNHNGVIPVSKASRPGEDWSNAIGTGFASLLVNSVVTCNCAMSSFSFYGFPIRANLSKFNQIQQSHILI